MVVLFLRTLIEICICKLQHTFSVDSVGDKVFRLAIRCMCVDCIITVLVQELFTVCDLTIINSLPSAGLVVSSETLASSPHKV